MEDLSKLKLYGDEKSEPQPAAKSAQGKGRSRSGRVEVVIALIVCLAAGFGVGYLSKPGANAIEVTTDYAARQSSERPVVARRESGWIEVPDDQYPLYITSLVTGRLEKVMVRKGMKVKAGQEIARVYGNYFKSELEKSKSEFAAARANYDKLKSGFRTQEVAQAKARAEKASAQVKKAKAALMEADADLVELKHQMDLANVTYVRAIPLVKTEAISEQRLDELKSEHDEAKARHAKAGAAVRAAAAEVDLAKAAHMEAEEQFKLMEEGYRSEDIDSAQARMKQSEAKYRLAELQYENRIITSPWSGVVLHQFKHAGDLVSYPGMKDGPSGIVASVYNPKKLQARIQLDLDRIQGIFENQSVLITTAVEGPSVTYAGRVVRLDPEADYKNNVVWVKVDILDPSEKLHPEMVCKAQFLEPEQEKAADGEKKLYVLIPHESVVERGGKTFVFTIEGGKARSVAVELGGTVGGKRVVKNGLSGGEELITSGHASLSDGAPVRKRSNK